MNGLLGLIILVLDTVAIVSVVKSAMTGGKKILWILVILLIPVIGMILYFVIGNKKASA